MSTVAKPRTTTRSHLEPERRLVIRGARWDYYLTLIDSLSEHTSLRVAFDGKDIEIMTNGNDHEQFSFRLPRSTGSPSMPHSKWPSSGGSMVRTP